MNPSNTLQRVLFDFHGFEQVPKVADLHTVWAFGHLVPRLWVLVACFAECVQRVGCQTACCFGQVFDQLFAVFVELVPLLVAASATPVAPFVGVGHVGEAVVDGFDLGERVGVVHGVCCG